jgi:hypothetical protein
MRIHVDLTSHLSGDPQIIQVEKVPENIETAGDPDAGTALNGKYLIPVPLGRDFHVDELSYVLNAGDVDGGDVASIGFAHLLASFPQYGNIYFNPLLTAEHLVEVVTDPANQAFVDRTVTPAQQMGPRFQTGRASGNPDPGQAPNMTALLPANTRVTPNRPGLFIGESIDIGPYTLDCNSNEVGADQFMLYWKIYRFDTSADVAADYGALAGTNTPAVKKVYEIDQEDPDFRAYVSVDGGANWCAVGLLEPVGFCQKTTDIQVAFRNDGSDKLYLAHFAVMF